MRSRRGRWAPAAVLAGIVWAGSAQGAIITEDEVCFIAGQSHPRFQLTVSLNGYPVRSVQSSPGRPKSFLVQLLIGTVRKGSNLVSVAYKVLSPEEGGRVDVPSFHVQLKCQKTVQAKETGRVLLRLDGPARPFPAAGASGQLQGAFRYP